MKILLISYSDYRYDGRLRALISVFSRIGDTVSFMKEGPENPNFTICNQKYGAFLREAYRFAKAMGTIDMLVLDNRRAIPAGLLIKFGLRPRLTVFDCRELYLISERPDLKGKLGCLLEKKSIGAADLIICANSFRSAYMKDYYHLSKKPLVYENLRRLRYQDDAEEQSANEYVRRFLRPGEYRIISTSGCDFSRTNDILVSNLDRVRYPCRLFLAGDSEEKDERGIRRIIKEKALRNVEIIPKLNQARLKALISHSHIGIVNYHQQDLNNKFCASGKLYEFAYEGLPIVSTTNPPLSSLCRDYGIGVADDLYADGINEVIADYERYKGNVRRFAAAHTVEENDDTLIYEIRRALNLTEDNFTPHS